MAQRSPLGVTAKVTTHAYNFRAIGLILKWPPSMQKWLYVPKNEDICTLSILRPVSSVGRAADS